MSGLVTNVYHHVGTSLAIVFAVLLLAAFVSRRPRINLAVAVGILLMCLVIPVRWTNAFVFIGSAIGPVSASFMVLAGYGLYTLVTEKPAVSPRDEALLVYLISGSGLLLYSTYLGFIPLSIYGLGFQTPGVFLVPVIVLVLAAFWSSTMTMVWVITGMLIWLLSLSGSSNLWDAFIDPLGFFAALVLSVAHLFGMIGKPLKYPGLRMSSRP